MKIIWHGHSSFTIAFSDIKIIVDPFLSGNPNFGNQNMDEITSELTHIALTHGHNDHVGDTVDLAKKTMHSTASEAAKIASAANVGKLILGHFSNRYKNQENFLKEAKIHFKNVFLKIVLEKRFS